MPASVDDVWRQLQSQQRPSLNASDLRDVPGIKRSVRDLSKPVSTAAGSAQVQINSLEGLNKTTDAQRPAQAVSGSAVQLQRDINCLRDPDRSKRRSAVSALNRKLFADRLLQASDLQAQFVGDLGTALAALLADSSEKCRELSADIFLKTVGSLPQPSALLTVLAPVLCRRLSSGSEHEPSEEVRLKLVRLLAALTAASGASLQQHVGDIVVLSCAALADPFPDIKKAGCQAIADTAEHVPRSHLTEYHEALIHALNTNLSHQHSRIRLACLSALQPLVSKGIAGPLLMDVVAPIMSQLAVDVATSVRISCFAAVHSWLSQPREMSWYSSFLPVLLLSHTDESQSIVSSSSVWLSDAARAFSRAQAKDGASDTVMSHANVEDGQEGGVSPSSATLQGVSMMVQTCLGSMLPQLAKGLQEWTVGLRCKAARMLLTALQLAGGGAADHLLLLLPALRHARGDDAQEVQKYAAEALHAVGLAVPAHLWLRLSLEPAQLPAATIAERTIALTALTDLLAGLGVSEQVAEAEVLTLLAKAVASPELRETPQLPLQQQLLALINALLAYAGQQAQQVSRQLWITLLQQQAWSYSPAVQGQAAAASPSGVQPAVQALHAPAESAMTQLAGACRLQDAAALTALHGVALLPVMQQGQADWDEESHQAMLFVAMLHGCGAHALLAMADGIHHILEAVIVPSSRPAQLRLQLLKALQDLAQDDALAGFFTGAVSQRIVHRVILPCLVWRAGSVPAVVRGCCMMLLKTFMEQHWLADAAVHDLIQDGILLPLLFQTLDDDYFADTRELTCQSLQCVLRSVQLSSEHIISLRAELQKRLDDASNAVRIAACRAMATSAAKADALTAQQLVQSMAVHMDDDDAAVRAAVCDVFVALAAAQPAAVQDVLADACSMHRDQTHMQTVLQACLQ